MSARSYIAEAIKKLRDKQDLVLNQASRCITALLAGELADDEIIEFLEALAEKGESEDEIVGAYFALKQRGLHIPNFERPVADICGTGGSDRVKFPSKFNVSTAAAFVVASAGVSVTKFGNRGSSNRPGSFDVLDELGCRFGFSVRDFSRVMGEVGIAFLFAPACYPALHAVRSARKKIARRTIFNIVGPLLNPANPQYQVIGVTDVYVGEKIAHVLKRLGCVRALVVAGHDGIDELMLTGISRVWDVSRSKIFEHGISPSDFSLVSCDERDLRGGAAKQNVEILFDMFTNAEGCESPLGQMVAVNAGALLYCSGNAPTIVEGYRQAEILMKSGKAFNKIVQYRRFFGY